MSVLVIGGTGFIGLRVSRQLAERGEDVVCMDIDPAGAASFAAIEDRVKVVRGDVTQFEDVIKTMVETKPERVINLAYLLGRPEGNPHFAMKLNILGMDNCFEAARLCGVKRVVYASSVAVSGLQTDFGDRYATEGDPTYGTTRYAVHKIFNGFQAEQYIKSYGMSITGIRPANVTGPDKVWGSIDHVQCITLPARGEPVRLLYKSVMWCPIHVDDIAEAFVRVTLCDSPRYNIYNSGGHTISIGQLADMVCEFEIVASTIQYSRGFGTFC